MTEDPVSMRDYVDARLEALEARLLSERTSDLRAGDIKSLALEHRLIAMNEFRTQIERERGDFMPRSEWNAQIKAAEDTHVSLDVRLRRLETMQAWIWGAMAALGLAWSIIDRVFVAKVK